MNDQNLQSKALSSLIWKLFERAGAKIIAFIVSIVLARLLSPDDYGAIALITIFTAVAQVFIQGGFTQALIQKKDTDDLDYSSVFYCSLSISIILYLLIYFIIAPCVAVFYKMPILTDVLRVLSLTIVIGTYNSMQNTLLAKKLLFKKLFWSSFGSIIFAGILGVVFAYAGFGVWALVAQQLSAVIMTSIIMTFTIKWRPKLLFSLARLKVLFGFGWKLLCSGLIEEIYQNVYSLIIGKKYSSANLAYWNRGKQFPMIIVDNINSSINAVMYPVMSGVQEERDKLKAIVRRSIKMSAYLLFPSMMGLAICAEPVVSILLTDKWLECVPYLQGWCFCYAWYPIHTVNLQVYKAMGRSDIFLKLEIVKKIVGITVLCITLPFGIWTMMCGMFGTTILNCIINSFPNSKLLKYGYLAQIKDLFPSILLTCGMGVCVWAISLIGLSTILTLILQVITGVGVYLIGSLIFKVEAFTYIMGMLKGKFKK